MSHIYQKSVSLFIALLVIVLIGFPLTTTPEALARMAAKEAQVLRETLPSFCFEAWSLSTKRVALRFERLILPVKEPQLARVKLARLAKRPLPEERVFRDALNRVLSTVYCQTLKGMGILAMKRACTLAMLSFFFLPFIMAVLFDAYVVRRIRIAGMRSPRPTLFNAALSGLVLLLEGSVILFFIPIYQGIEVLFVLLSVGSFCAWLALSQYHRFL